jgi:hypothetical protein
MSNAARVPVLDKRSPLTARPLRQAGDSVQNRLVDLAFGRLLPLLWLSSTVWLIVLYEALASMLHWPAGPKPLFIPALGVTGIVAYAFLKARPWVDDLRLGREGERAVGEFLERLRGTGAHVFHDIPCGRFNLDHVVLCERGLFVVETKTRRTPSNGQDPTVQLRRGHLLIAGSGRTSGPLRQVQGGSRWLAEFLSPVFGRHVWVRGVVLFPGWQVEPMAGAWLASDRPWVLAPAELPDQIAREPASLNSDEVARAAAHLSRYVRGKQAEALTGD